LLTLKSYVDASTPLRPLSIRANGSSDWPHTNISRI